MSLTEGVFCPIITPTQFKPIRNPKGTSMKVNKTLKTSMVGIPFLLAILARG